MRQHTMGFQFLGGEAHNAIYLGNKLSRLIRDFGITNRVFQHGAGEAFAG
jgi:hypothetical protein